MIERTVERAENGGIERILERSLTPLEETVELAWPHVKRLLRQRHVADLSEVEITIANIPATVDPRAVVNAICERITSEPDGFVNTKFQRLIFVLGARPS
jgi:hypothetical protein